MLTFLRGPAGSLIHGARRIPARRGPREIQAPGAARNVSRRDGVLQGVPRYAARRLVVLTWGKRSKSC